MTVAMPPTVAQMKPVVALLDRARELKRQQGEAIDELTELTEGISKMLPAGSAADAETAPMEIFSNRVSTEQRAIPKRASKKPKARTRRSKS